jgi:hypothetical protein
MKGIFKCAVWLIVAAVSVNALMAHEIVSSTQVPQSAGCHESGNKAPAPASYQCCQAGHDVAIVKASVVPTPIAEDSVRVQVLSSVTSVESLVVTLPEISGGPPGIFQLRI